MMPRAKLENTVGGCAQQEDASSRPGPRYSKVTVDWKTEMLHGGVQQVRVWLTSRGAHESENLHVPRFVTLDVLVPTVRYGFVVGFHSLRSGAGAARNGVVQEASFRHGFLEISVD